MYVGVEIGVPGWGDGSGRTGKGGEKRRLVVFWFLQGIFLCGRKNVAEDAFQFGCLSQEEFFCGERVVLFFPHRVLHLRSRLLDIRGDFGDG